MPQGDYNTETENVNAELSQLNLQMNDLVVTVDMRERRIWATEELSEKATKQARRMGEKNLQLKALVTADGRFTRGGVGMS
jgi:hypothetical protein